MPNTSSTLLRPSLNPLAPSATPDDYDLRSRCQNTARYDQMLRACWAHSQICSTCRGYDAAAWLQPVPLIGAAHRNKYTDLRRLDVPSTCTILALLDQL
ncbi:hypothetical protein ACIBCO_37505 [Streptomyces violascens]|uniref:hypothetical protein n=1 Tax=Streptomyces violascens TaxID=67381 RepID=UPI0037967565